MIQRSKKILPAIVASQMMATSLWFSGNAILEPLQDKFQLGVQAAGAITSSVQFGFIGGTLLFAFFVLADRFSPQIVFFVCSIGGALANLGKAIGFLVGALVVGTALPHLLKGLGQQLPWQMVVFTVSGIATLGGLLMLVWVPDGPHLSKNSRFHPGALIHIFKSKKFRSSAFGYFGHMWELYTFWAFVPLIVREAASGKADLNIPLWSFCIIAAGSVGCVWGGVTSLKHGSAKVAAVQLSASGICCLLSPLMFFASLPIFLAFLIFWGIVVVGDSPQFSTLNAQNAPKERVGSALTIANCIGFAITIISILLLSELTSWLAPQFWLLPLALGPLLGLIAMKPLFRPE